MKAIRYGFLMMSLALAGCASGFSVAGPLEETYQKGETSPDVFLSTVIVRPGGCAPVGAACTMAGPRGAVVIVPFSPETPGWMYEMFAHEICHVVAAVRELQPDPCHQEDHGKIVIHKNRPLAPSGAVGIAAQEGSSSGHFRLMPDPLVTRVP
jgi:hypothetical protein